MCDVLANVIVPFAVFVGLILLAIVIAYAFTGERIGEFGEPYVLDLIVLIVGFAIQYFFRGDRFVSGAISGTLSLTFFVVPILDKKRGRGGLAFGELSEGTGVKAGCKDLKLMLCNASVIVIPCLVLSSAFQAVSNCNEYVLGPISNILCVTLESLAGVSLAILIAYRFTGVRIGEFKEPYSINFLILAVGFIAQYFLRDDYFAACLVQNAIALSLFAITFLDKKRDRCGIVIGELPKETGAEAGREGLRVMLINAFVMVPSCFIVSWVFQCVVV